MKTLWMAVASLVMTGFMCMTTGCKDKEAGGGKEVSSETEIHEKLGGGTEIEKKEVIQTDEGVETRRTTTDIDKHGNVEKEKVEVTPPDTEEPKKDVEVRIGGDGIKVNVQEDKDSTEK